MEKGTILIVDDEPRYIQLIAANLVVDGFNVLEALDGEKAVEIVSEQDIDLVLLDVMMPKLDGFETCRRIRGFSQVPIIMVTAKGDESDRVQGLNVGADDYIVKPVVLL